MFSYYGGKGRIASWYPVPRYPLVIEPFAGAAWYSVRHQLGKEAWLFDVNPVVVSVWQWLIDEATEEDVWSVPTPIPGQPLARYEHPGKDAWYRFWGNQGTEYPRNIAGRFHAFQESWRRRYCRLLRGVKRWTVRLADYRTAPDVEATWFIDPPYSQQSRYKSHAPLDYGELAEWCRSRRGQVIVCESMGATWLPFRPLRPGRRVGQRRGSRLLDEVYWTNDEDNGVMGGGEDARC
jgi:hypothetical protein